MPLYIGQLKSLPSLPDDADCPLEDPLSALVDATRERLEGNTLEATASTNFGRDVHEAKFGSVVTSVKLSVAEVDLLRARLAASEAALRAENEELQTAVPDPGWSSKAARIEHFLDFEKR